MTKTQFNYFSEDRYEFTHGKRPRGRGAWAFTVKFAGPGGFLTESVVHFNATYTTARREALAHATAYMPADADRALVAVCT